MAHHTVLIQLLIILLVGSIAIDAFFTGGNFSYVGTRNVTCGLAIDYYALLPDQRNITGWNGIMNMTWVHGNDFCLIEQIHIILRNGTVVNSTLASVINGYSYFKQYTTGRCSSGQFWPSVTPIGYGTCTRLPYETYSLTLCICSTNNCNADYSTCVASVQATQSSPPPNLPSPIPELTNQISCRQGYQGSTYHDMYYGVGWLYNEYTPFNMSEARAYQSSHAVACMLYVNVQTGDWYQIAVLYEEYSSVLFIILTYRNINFLSMYAESSTSVAAQMLSAYFTNSSYYWHANTFTQIMCLCTTNNCNQDLSTCAIGLNVSVSNTTTAPVQSTNITLQTTMSTLASTNQTISPTVTSISTARNTTSTARTTVASTASSTPSPRTCFSGTSRVRREDGSVIMLRDARVGDRFLDAENKYSPLLTFFVHQQQGPLIDYLQIITEESTLEITPSHLILIRLQDNTNSPRYLQATRLRPGDSVFSIQSDSNVTMKEMKIIRVQRNVKRIDAFAPMIKSGTLVVNDMIVSCYAQYEYHSLIHLFMFPLRFWKTINSYQTNELHPYIHFWLHASRFLDLFIHNI